MQANGRFGGSLSLSFRTPNDAGLIFSISNYGTSSTAVDFITLEIYKGRLLYHVSLGGSPVYTSLGASFHL